MRDDQFPIDPMRNRGLPVPGHPGDRRMPVPNAGQYLAAHEIDEDEEIDLLAYWRILVKRRWLICGVICAVVTLSLIWTLLTPSTYRATAVLQIDSDGIEVMQVQGISPQQGAYDPEFNQTQYELLKSRVLAERVAEDLGLPGSDIYERLQPPSWLDRLRRVLSPGARDAAKDDAAGSDRERVAADAGTEGDAGRHPATEDLRKATRLIRRGLLIEPVRNSHLVRIHYDATQPAFAARVANGIADGFIALTMDRQFGASSYARKYLEDQLAQLRSRLEDSERALVDFAQKEDIVPSVDGQSLEGKNLADLNASLAKAQDQRIRAEARWKSAQSGAALPSDMLDGSIVRTLQEQRAQLQGQYRDKLQTFKPDYPSMLALKGQIDELQAQIAHELANIRASVKAEYEEALSQEKMLQDELSGLRSQTLAVDSRSIQYNILKRDVDTNRQLYNALLQRYKEVGIAGGVKSSNISVVDHAEVPRFRHSPSLSRNLSLGLLVGTMLAVLLALLLDHVDDTVKAPRDVEHHLHLAVLGIIPKLSRQSPNDALADPRSAFSESYRSVRTALQFSTDRGVPNVLLITSPGSHEGKSTSALTLARNFAQLGKRVLLIEGDLRNPSLSRAAGISTTTGLSSLLAGAVTMAQAISKTEDERLDLMLSGPLPPSPTELLAGPKLVSLLMTGAEKYDQVIIDGPPVLGIADAPIMANIAAGTLLIVQSGATRISTAQSAIKRLRGTRARLIGALLTQYDSRSSGYGYTYEGYYAGSDTPRLSSRQAR